MTATLPPITPPLRARVHRDGPGMWSFEVVDHLGYPIVMGHGHDWRDVLNGAVGELRMFAEAEQRKPAEEPPLISAAAADRSWLAKLLGVR
jgi:hypothetical protein